MKNKLKDPKVVTGLVILALILTNVLTGWAVYSKKEREYTSLRNSIQSTIDQKIKMGQQLQAYQEACPDVVVEE